MKLHRFFIEQPITSSSFELTDKKLIHQLANVLKIKAGKEILNLGPRTLRSETAGLVAAGILLNIS